MGTRGDKAIGNDKRDNRIVRDSGHIIMYRQGLVFTCVLIDLDIILMNISIIFIIIITNGAKDSSVSRPTLKNVIK